MSRKSKSTASTAAADAAGVVRRRPPKPPAKKKQEQTAPPPLVIWEPQPRQAAFMRRAEYEGLYGGAAGGGKSDALLAEALRQVDIPHYRGILLRKTYPQLSELIDRSYEIYKPAYAQARYNDSKHLWLFPSGAKIYFGAMQHSKDRLNYQGKRYDFIGFDEMTHFTWSEYSYLFSRNRPSGAGTRCYIRGTANPGGVGHGWVKARFVTPGKANATIWERIKFRYPDGQEVVRWRSRVFVPSTVFDNAVLLANRPEYLDSLAMLPEAERKALLYGDWDTFAGQVFVEWRDDSDHYADRLGTHVISPFQIPSSWAVWRAFDWGYSRPFSVGWYAVDHERRLYRIRELYGSNGAPNVGVKWEPVYLAEQIKRIEAEDPNLRGRDIHGVADPAIFNSGGFESVAALMERNRVWFEPGDHDRLNGKMQVHYRLAFDQEGVPMLYVFSTCKHFIRTLPALVYDERDVEDVDSDGEDHAYDELRYICMANPIAPRQAPKTRLVVYDPLSTDDDMTGYDRYDYYRRY